ncbi:carbohydrate ABC transporter membrane protein 1 (CUT1 family) [Stella humosa]|uniref:sn-glycerol-3-phosphate transport system permease protein UgpA n=1 Tax=Stella humosa TaxID=94 RepID=A0A3N1KPR4_9PROT|nr:carbohydrate ABC transporter membrane protein 1 (CUT1 family) [Stella humosa]BBK32641.1 glycerol-3-phosphate transporter permease [Stella humosa]
MIGKKVIFRSRGLPLLLLAPQLLVILVFFFWPAGQAVYQAFHLADPFGQHFEYVGLDNFRRLFNSPEYYASLWATTVFSAGVAIVSLGSGLLLAAFVDHVRRGRAVYKSLIIWPYAVAPVLAGVLWLFLFHPIYGVVAFALARIGIGWNPLLNSNQAMALVVMAAAWKQVSYNFVFFLAGLQAIPRSVLEAAAIDGAGPLYRFRTIVLPLLTPTTFFLLVINLVYAFFDTFGIIHAVTHGGPGGATNILVYKVFADGFIGQDLGSSAAQSIVLMVIVVSLTVLQFRFLERKVHYG